MENAKKGHLKTQVWRESAKWGKQKNVVMEKMPFGQEIPKEK